MELLERSKQDMMGGGSDGEDEFRVQSSSSSRRFKLNGKAFDDGNAVDPATVPRRLRSAMNKRNHEPISPPLPDPKKRHVSPVGAETLHVNGIRRSKLHMKLGGLDRSPKQVLSNSITKDEEEVVEALYALASMSDEPAKITAEERKEEKMPSPQSEVGTLPTSEALQESIELGLEAVNLTMHKEVPTKTENVEPMGVPTLPEPSTSGDQKLELELISAAQESLLGSGLLAKDEETGHTHLNDIVDSINPIEVPSESYRGNGSLETKHAKSLPIKRSDNVPHPTVAHVVREEVKPIKENNGSCTQLEGTPDLHHGVPMGLSGGHQNIKKSSTKAGAGTDSASLVGRLGLTQNNVSKEKRALVSFGRRQPLKRCVLHVYVSHFVRAYQRADRKEDCLPSTNKAKLNEGTKSGITASNDPTVLNTGTINLVSAGTHGSVADGNLHETRLGILQDNRLLQDQQASTSSGINSLQKQSYDFLSLSTGCESNRNSGNGLEAAAQLHVPYLNSLVQHPVTPYSLPHTRYSSSPYSDQLASAASQQAHLQVPQYAGNPFYGPQLGYGSSAKQQQQQQQHQQQMWSAQMVRYRPCSPPFSHPKWQNGRNDSPSFIPCTQPVGPLLPSSLEVLGPRYAPTQQQLFAIPSCSSLTKDKRQQQHHHHPSNYDEGHPMLHSDVAPQLHQLLCNAQNL